MEIEEMNQTQQLPWLVNNVLFCYEGDKHTGNQSKRKQHFLYHKEKRGSSKEAYTDASKITGRKVVYTAVFTDTARKGALPEEVSIHTAEMTAINKTAMKETKEREDIRGVK